MHLTLTKIFKFCFYVLLYQHTLKLIIICARCSEIKDIGVQETLDYLDYEKMKKNSIFVQFSPKILTKPEYYQYYAKFLKLNLDHTNNEDKNYIKWKAIFILDIRKIKEMISSLNQDTFSVIRVYCELFLVSMLINQKFQEKIEEILCCESFIAQNKLFIDQLLKMCIFDQRLLNDTAIFCSRNSMGYFHKGGEILFRFSDAQAFNFTTDLNILSKEERSGLAEKFLGLQRFSRDFYYKLISKYIYMNFNQEFSPNNLEIYSKQNKMYVFDQSIVFGEKNSFLTDIFNSIENLTLKNLHLTMFSLLICFHCKNIKILTIKYCKSDEGIIHFILLNEHISNSVTSIIIYNLDQQIYFESEYKNLTSLSIINIISDFMPNIRFSDKFLATSNHFLKNVEIHVKNADGIKYLKKIAQFSKLKELVLYVSMKSMCDIKELTVIINELILSRILKILTINVVRGIFILAHFTSLYQICDKQIIFSGILADKIFEKTKKFNAVRIIDSYYY